MSLTVSLCVLLPTLTPPATRRSSKVAVALAAGGLVPPLLDPLREAVAGPPGRAPAPASASASAPILRAKLLDIISIMYQHHPRPKEFIMKYRIQVSMTHRIQVGGGKDWRPMQRGTAARAHTGTAAARAGSERGVRRGVWLGVWLGVWVRA